ncbi:MAG: radical SAM protein [Candidatus Baldrarchaeia archaeon]
MSKKPRISLLPLHLYSSKKPPTAENMNVKFVNYKGRLGSELVVGPSMCMSSLCYSIFKLEPYSGCSHQCAYCYARKFPGNHSTTTARLGYPEQIKKYLQRANMQWIPFRLSTLSDPFQPPEKSCKLSLKLLKICQELNIPVIISTKSPLPASEPWLSTIKRLAEEKLTITQFTVILLDDKKSRIIEPGAPPPSERLKAMEKLADEDIPVIARLQPIIPFVNSDEEFLEEYVTTMKSIGTRQIIAECYRFLGWKELSLFKQLISEEKFKILKDRQTWEYYPDSPFKRPTLPIRLQILQSLAEICKKHDMKFSTCREGFFHLHTAENCCGMHHFQRYIIRPTLHEVWKITMKRGEITIPDVIRCINEQNKKFLENVTINGVRRILLKHMKTLECTLRSNLALSKICPVLKLEDAKIKNCSETYYGK